MSKRPRWHFSPIGSGPEYVAEPSSAYFSDSPIPKLVREVIQNSLDAKDRAFDDPVTVKFSEIQVPRKRIGGEALSDHLKSCLARAYELGRPGPIDAYRNALKTAGSARIRCLKIQDAGTTGLVGPHWDALVRQEGAVNKADASAGGSYGIGKNAALNVSDLQTVFYGTRYIAGRRGRIDLLQGKATLMAHPAPKGAAVILQHIGFYAAPDGEPITGRRAMPSCFELDEPGTGVFIMGFNPHSEGDSWVSDVARAAAENFFCAIHQRRLRVEVKSLDDESASINHETLDRAFSDFGADKSDAAYYYRAIRDCTADVVRTEALGELGRLNVYAAFSDGAPDRLAYINRNGMLITDSREQRVNPLAPRRRAIWPKYAAVAIADSDAGDAWIRRMENPSHDSISPTQIGGGGSIRYANTIFQSARRAIREIIDDKADITQYGKESNLDELAHLFRDETDPANPGDRELSVRKRKTQRPPIQPDDPGDEDHDGSDDGGDNDDANGKRKKRRKRRRNDNGVDPNPRRRPPTLTNPQFIPQSSREGVLAFTAAQASDEPVRIALAPAGADSHPGGAGARPAALNIIQAQTDGDIDIGLRVENGAIVCRPPANERVVLKIVSDADIDGYAFTLREARDG